MEAEIVVEIDPRPGGHSRANQVAYEHKNTKKITWACSGGAAAGKTYHSHAAARSFGHGRVGYGPNYMVSNHQMDWARPPTTTNQNRLGTGCRGLTGLHFQVAVTLGAAGIPQQARG